MSINIWNIIIIFYIYSFFGWVMEVCISFYKFHKFINRGFLIGPICPIYGFGGIIGTLLFSKFSTFENIRVESGILNVIIIFIGAVIICSILEYFTSWLMEKLFHARWWDYSKEKFNLNGRICLQCSLGFGIGVLAVLYIFNPLLSNIINHGTTSINILSKIDIILMLITFIDFVISFNIINKLKGISNSINSDSTEKITKKVKLIINKNSNYLYKRLIKSFPDIKIGNTWSNLKNKLNVQKEKLKIDSIKLKIREEKIKKLEKKLNKIERNEKINDFLNIFKINKK